MSLEVAALAGTVPPHPMDGAHLRVALLSVGWTLGFCCTGTLDYAVARSTLVLASPWWMPFSWAVAAVQVCGPRFAVGLGAATGVVTILAGTVGWGVIEFICRGRGLPGLFSEAREKAAVGGGAA